MNAKQQTILKIIGIILCLGLCGVFSWYYLRTSSRAGHKRPAREVVQPKKETVVPQEKEVQQTPKKNNIPKNNSLNNSDEGDTKTIGSWIREYKASIGMLVGMIFLYFIYQFRSNNSGSSLVDTGLGSLLNDIGDNTGQLPPNKNGPKNVISTNLNRDGNNNKSKLVISPSDIGKLHNQSNTNLKRTSEPKKKKKDNTAEESNKRPLLQQKPPQNNQITLKKPLIKKKLDKFSTNEFKYTLGIIQCMIKAKSTLKKQQITTLDKKILAQLILSPKYFTDEVKQLWEKFRKQQKIITIDMQYMYLYYQAFIPELASPDSKEKNLLFFNKIAKLFPYARKIVCKESYGITSNFMLGLKDQLSKMKPHTKLTKIVIETSTNKIGDDCKLYVTEFGTMGWQIGKGTKTIVLTKEPYKRIYRKAIRKISDMIQREPPSAEATSLDVPVLEKLIAYPKKEKQHAGKTKALAGVQQLWNKLRLHYQQQRITINMQYMYTYYQAFLPLLCVSDSKLKNLLQLNKLAKLFPNVNTIIYEETDYVGSDAEKYSPDKYGYSSAIVGEAFMLGILNCLKLVGKQAKFTNVVIHINTKGSDFKPLAEQFKNLGWKIGKRPSSILVTKESWDVIGKATIGKITSMINGNGTLSEVSSLDVEIVNKLISGEKGLPTDVQNLWNAFSNKQQRIKLSMYVIYSDYEALRPLLFDEKCKNLLLLDNIVKLFPNATEIGCFAIDWFSPTKFDHHSPNIVDSNFILRLQKELSKIYQRTTLHKIVIQTSVTDIANDCNLHATGFEKLNWLIGKGSKTVVITKEPYEVRCKDVIRKISAMIQGKKTRYEATSLDVPIFNQLILEAKDIPADVQKQWDKLRNQQQSITINMEYMHEHYQAFLPLLSALAPKKNIRNQQTSIITNMYNYSKAFIPVLFASDSELKNLLQLNKLAKLFPNVNTIIYEETDYVGSDAEKYSPDKYGYSSAIVGKAFMLGILNCLKQVGKQAKLTNVVIHINTKGSDFKLLAEQFETLGWQIWNGSKTIAVTTKPYNVVCEEAITKISSMIQGKLSLDKATYVDEFIFNQLISNTKEVPAAVQKKWNELRDQNVINIDIEYMYKYYKAFVPLFFDLKTKNLLLLDSIVKLFPKVTEIICKNTDYVGEGAAAYELDEHGYSADIVGSEYIRYLLDALNKLPKDTVLLKVTIQTSKHKIKHATTLEIRAKSNYLEEDDIDTDALEEEIMAVSENPEESVIELGQYITHIGQRFVIVHEANKLVAKAIHIDFIDKLKSMLTGKSAKVPDFYVSIFNKLILRAKDVPDDLQQSWNKFRHQQQRIRIDMDYMYKFYEMFITILFSSNPKRKNLLLFDKIAELFPNANEIICEVADCVSAKWEYSSSIVSSNFMLGVQDCLSKMLNNESLRTIIIKTRKKEIKYNCSKLDVAQLGWKIEKTSYVNKHGDAKKNSQITLTRLKNPVIEKQPNNTATIPITKKQLHNFSPTEFAHTLKVIQDMINGTSLYPDEVNDSDKAIFNQLIVQKQKLPFNWGEKWDEFKDQQKIIKIDMEYMHEHYQAFIPLLFDPKCKNLLLFNKLMKIFPNVTEIICKNTDWNEGKKAYSSDIVNLNFIEKLKIPKETKLEKITIKSFKNKIAYATDLDMFAQEFINKEALTAWKKYVADGDIDTDCICEDIVHDKKNQNVIDLNNYEKNQNVIESIKAFQDRSCSLVKGDNTLVVMKTPNTASIADKSYDDCIEKLKLIFQGKSEGSNFTNLDMFLFNRLTLGAQAVPKNIQEKWNGFIKKQKDVTISIWSICGYHKALIPLFFSTSLKRKNLLRLGTIVSLFPDVVQITFSKTNYVEETIGDFPFNTTQFEKFKFYNVKEDDSSLILFKLSANYIKKSLVPIIRAMISGEDLGKEQTPIWFYAFIFKKLTSGSNATPPDAKKEWDDYRKKQQRIKIDMYYMYNRYKAFIPLLCSSNPEHKNLLLFDKIAKIFPNATQIVCEKTSYLDNDKSKYNIGAWGYATNLVNAMFMAGLQKELSKMDEQAKIATIIINKGVEQKVEDYRPRYALELEQLGWHIGRGNKTIALTKAPYDDYIKKISEMTQGKEPSDPVTSVDNKVFDQLNSDRNDKKYVNKEKWESYKEGIKSIKINMYCMYEYYKELRPQLCSLDQAHKTILLLDEIVKLFPNVTAIVCENTDYDEGLMDEDGDKGDYSPDIVNLDFMSNIYKRLPKDNMKDIPLKTIIINTSEGYMVDSNSLEQLDFGALEWKIWNGSKTIAITTKPYNLVFEETITKISSMIQGRLLLAKVTYGDEFIFNQLISNTKEVPPDVQKKWASFREEQKRIIIDMDYIYQFYEMFITILFSSNPKRKNLLLFDKIAKLFPNANEIICDVADCVSAKWEYSSSIVNSNFMFGVQGCLSGMLNNKSLRKIIIKTRKKEIKDDCELYTKQFKTLGWKIEKTSYVNKHGEAKKDNQITLTRLQATKASFTNGPLTSSGANENKHNDHYSVDNEVFDID